MFGAMHSRVVIARKENGWTTPHPLHVRTTQLRRWFDLSYLQSAVRSRRWPIRTLRFAVYPVSYANFASVFRKLPFRSFAFRRLLRPLHVRVPCMSTGSWSKQRQVITATPNRRQKSRVKTVTGENGESQNGDKPCNECECVCVDVNAVSVTVVVHLRHLKFHQW